MQKHFLAIIQPCASATEGEIVTIFHFWSDTESVVTLIFGSRLETGDCIDPLSLNIPLRQPNDKSKWIAATTVCINYRFALPTMT